MFTIELGRYRFSVTDSALVYNTKEHTLSTLVIQKYRFV